MPELMAGQIRSVSVSRRREQTISSEAQQMLVTPVIEHLVRFVYEGAKDSDPTAGKEDELRTTDGVLLSELLDTRSEPEEEEVVAEQAQVSMGS